MSWISLTLTLITLSLVCRFEKVELFQVKFMFMRFRLLVLSSAKNLQEPWKKSDLRPLQRPSPLKNALPTTSPASTPSWDVLRVTGVTGVTHGWHMTQHDTKWQSCMMTSVYEHSLHFKLNKAVKDRLFCRVEQGRKVQREVIEVSPTQFWKANEM